MLVALRIKNLALVEDLSLELESGFNAITGETGAGKSILIGALNLTLGERADRDWIRNGADSCTVEAIFDVSDLKSLSSLLEELGIEPCQDKQLILKRVFTSAGANRQFANGSPCTLQALKQIGELLVDMHGPHDHQSLLRTEAQLRILDGFAGLENQRVNFSKHLQALRDIEERKKALVIDEKEFQRQLDLLQHQVQEIDTARITPDEEEKIESNYRLATNSQKLIDLLQRAQEALSEGETNATSALNQAQRALGELAKIDPGAGTFEESNRSLVIQLQDLTQNLSRYLSKVDVDPDRLQFLSERMTLIQGLKRKYGKSLGEVLTFAEEARARLHQLQGREAELAKIEKEASATKQAMEKIGKSLRAAREKAIPKLAQTVSKHLKELGFAQSTFEAELKPCDPTPLGLDHIEFRFAPNPGEPTRPLREIASSGEMARVMLALKTALADQDEVPVLVFDEVDANVGGEIGNRVGEKMAQIGKRHQVICITHLPQVAVHAKSHHSVLKAVEKGRTFTQIEPLTSSNRMQEIARMLGGKSDTALKHAKEMLLTAQKK
jgi:DNA repair protein RecN (Recombination protein N)